MTPECKETGWIRSRRVVLPGGVKPAAVAIASGRIQAVAEYDFPERGSVVHECGEDVLMPGAIDAHVHINEPGRTDWEGFATATRAAAAGGVTTVVDMPLNSSPVTTALAALEEKVRAADGQLQVDCGFYGGVVPGNSGEVEALCEAGVLGMKAFLCHSGIDEFPDSRREDLEAVFPILARYGVPLLAHAELVSEDAADLAKGMNADPRSFGAWCASRPPAWEERAADLLIGLVERFRSPLHIVHVAAPGVLQQVHAARAAGLPVTAETCPHYLLFAEEEIEDGDTRYKCAPPIRNQGIRQLLRQALAGGLFDLLASDHSPAPPELKEIATGNVAKAWGGIASLQLLLPAAWTATRTIDDSLARFARMVTSGPADLLGLFEKGRIAPGRDADLVQWSPEASWTVDAGRLQHRHPVSPYDGMSLSGVVRRTWLRGVVVAADGAPAGEPVGRTIRRRRERR